MVTLRRPESECRVVCSESCRWSLGSAIQGLFRIRRIYKMDLNGNPLRVFGKTGKLPGKTEWVHGVACPDEHTVRR